MQEHVLEVGLAHLDPVHRGPGAGHGTEQRRQLRGGAVAEVGAVTTGVEVREPDLEDVFLHLTGAALRD